MSQLTMPNPHRNTPSSLHLANHPHRSQRCSILPSQTNKPLSLFLKLVLVTLLSFPEEAVAQFSNINNPSINIKDFLTTNSSGIAVLKPPLEQAYHPAEIPIE